MIYTDQMFNIAANATTLTALNAGVSGAVGNYNPPANGKLLRVIIGMSGQAATSLLEALRIELNCTTFIPNTLRFFLMGGGIRTAPAVPIPVMGYDVDQPVLAAQGIGGNYLFNVAAVTPNVQVLGVFSA